MIHSESALITTSIAVQCVCKRDGLHAKYTRMVCSVHSLQNTATRQLLHLHFFLNRFKDETSL